MKFSELSVGLSIERSREMTEGLVTRYAELTGDFSPVHVDEAAAAKTRFGTRIAHGMLSAGFLSAIIGMELPGPGAVWATQAFKFKKPVKIGDTITWRVEIRSLQAEKKRVGMVMVCRNQSGEVAIEGEGSFTLLE